MPMNPIDHERLHDWIARAALAGAAISVVELLLSAAGAASLGPVSAALFVVAVVAAIVPPRSVVDGAGLLLLGLGAAALAPLPTRLALPLSSLLVAVGLSRGLVRGQTSLRRRLEILGIATTAALAAAVIQRALAETGALTSLFGPGLGALAAAAIAGAVTGLGAVGRLLTPALPVAPPLSSELDRLAAEVTAANPEVGALLHRAADAHRRAAEVVSGLGQAKEAPLARVAADDLVGRMVRFGREWMEIESRANETRPESLTERVALLESRLEKTTDPIARVELGRAIQAISAQAAALDEILLGRERAVARLEHQVATLERLRLAALRHRSADAGRIQAELGPVLEELKEAGGDYDLASDALRDADQASEALSTDPLSVS